MIFTVIQTATGHLLADSTLLKEIDFSSIYEFTQKNISLMD